MVTNDKNIKGNNFSLTANEFIEYKINDYDIDCIDFDDEGMPQKEIILFFNKYKIKKQIIIFVTDGGIINAKIKGKINFKEYYLKEENFDKNYYENYEKYNIDLIECLCNSFNYKFEVLFSIRKNNTNAIYQGFLINP